METQDFLLIAITFLTSALIVVPIAKKLKLGNVLGYLLSGLIIGPSFMSLIDNPMSILHFAELGVVFLLFVIGLELKPQRLWAMRRALLGQGLLQVFITTLLLSLIAYTLQFSPQSSLVVGFALALSSTAFALQMLSEKKQMTTEFGRSSFSILLFQDVAAIPFMALIPYISGVSAPQGMPFWKAISILLIILIIAKFLIRHFFRFITLAKSREVFTAATLLIVLSVSYLMHLLHLSMALGAFLSGVLLSDSEYRHELEADIEPFKGLLLGLFFMAVGMSINMQILSDSPALVFGLLALYLCVKFFSLFLVGKISRFSNHTSLNLASTLVQGSEFAFVLLGVGVDTQLLPQNHSDLLILVISLSMAATPLISALIQKMAVQPSTANKKFDEHIEENPVIIAGFGRVGQICGRILRLKQIGFTALEHDPEQVEFLRKFGNVVFYGDASRLDLLEKAGAKNAKLFILAIDNEESSIEVAAKVKENFPNLKIIARARNRQHAFKLLDLGIQSFERETFWSSLKLSETMLTQLGFSKENIQQTISKFQFHDDRMLTEQHRIHHNEKDLINYAKNAIQQLQDVFRDDEKI